MSDLVAVGRVGRPHGLDGSFVVERPSEAPGRFAVEAELWVDGELARVVAAKRSGGRVVIRLDRQAARGAELAVPRASLPEPEPDSYYVFQLVGLDVVEDGGRRLGAVRDVDPGLANDILSLDTGILLPLVDDCILSVDLVARRIVVATGFADPE